jgi:hypothetical protein
VLSIEGGIVVWKIGAVVRPATLLAVGSGLDDRLRGVDQIA